ncbi:MAG: membrane dipeptidase [Verrucomicrobiota bacterium]
MMTPPGNETVKADKTAGGIIDMHFDLPLGLFLEHQRTGMVEAQYLPELEAGNVSLVGAAIYIEDEYLPEHALRVALDQAALLSRELERSPRWRLCRTFREIEEAEGARKIGLLLTMEGVEPLGEDLLLLRSFYELGLRSLSLTHARPNAAATGGLFAGRAPAKGLTTFGKELVEECERLGVILDLAHINPAGFEEVCALTSRPLIVSHTNARRFYDIERNISDEQIRMVGARGGVIGVNAILVSPLREEATLDRYIDHMEHVASLIGIDGVGLGFDFCEFIWNKLAPVKRDAVEARLTAPHFLPDLSNHRHTPNLIRRLGERGFNEGDIENVLGGNWRRVLRELL